MAVQEKTENAFNIAEFKSAIKHDYHSTSHFHFVFALPNGLSGQKSGTDDDFSKVVKDLVFEVESANVPGIQIATDDVFRYGMGSSQKKPYAPIFNKVDLMVRSDAEGKVYDFFQSWMKLIVNYDSRKGSNYTSGFGGAKVYEVNYLVDYAVEAQIITYSKVGEQVKKIYLRDCFPFLLGDVVHDWSDTNKLVKIPISLTFTDWYQDSFIQSVPNEMGSNFSTANNDLRTL